ncbi:MAG: hypothetical protein COB42_02345 [Sulfurimonas sp.]|nr:MAG: hypothetical protein COB42_02345 [Sulfurimonas sp.]
MIKIGVITMALLSFLHAGWFSGWFDTTPPFRIYVDLGKTGSVAEKEFKITKDKTYVLSLGYKTTYEKEQEDNHKERNKVTKILFGKYRTNGKGGKYIGNGYRTPIPIKITITETDKKRRPFIFEKTYFTSDGLPTSYFDMRLGHIKLVEGSYKIEIEILDGIQELVGIPIYVTLNNIRKLK